MDFLDDFVVGPQSDELFGSQDYEDYWATEVCDTFLNDQLSEDVI